MRHQRGFTLLELLVTISVVGVLGSIMAVGASALMRYANRVECASNLRQIGQAVLLYTQENEGDFPGSTHGGTAGDSWIYSLAPYLEDVDEVRVCPADPFAEEVVANRGTSYLLNEYLVVPRVEYGINPETGEPEFITEDFTNLRRIPSPAETYLAFPRTDNVSGLSTYQDHTHSRLWTDWPAVLRDIQPERHGDSANYLFVDGHVENIEPASLRERIEAGENFAFPPDA